MARQNTKGATILHDLNITLTVAEWVERAACRPEIAEWFWPLPGQTGGPDVEMALKICSRCPVVRQCGQWAIDNRIDEGIWGGMRPSALRRIADRRRGAVATP